MRAVNRVVVVVVALVLLVAVVILGVEIVLGLLGRAPWLLPDDRLAGFAANSWSAQPVLITGGVLAAIGLLLLLLEFRRGKPSAIELATDVPGLTLSAQRRSLEQLLRRAAEREAGVDSARVKVADRRVGVRASTYLKDSGDLQARVQRAVEERLDVLRLRRAARVKVDLQRKDRS
jgi:hypothetical protein